MKLGFLPVHLSERGTTTAVYDYAYFNETLFGNESVVFYQQDHVANFPANVAHFHNTFHCHAYRQFAEIDAVIRAEGIDALYCLKSGAPDGLLATACPNLVHSVFDNGPHGDKYAFVSQWLSDKYGGRHPYVPHMIYLPASSLSLRAELGIPAEAVVFGGYGGRHSFNIPFVHRCVEATVAERPDVYFLFMNFDPANTAPHPRIVYLEPQTDRWFKRKFINTCDAMIHARDMGETFGLAIGEFSSCNKPVLTFGGIGAEYDREHIRILGNRGLYYTDFPSLISSLRAFQPAPEQDWNCYRDFAPSRVMERFADVFLNTVTHHYQGKSWRLFKNDGISQGLLQQRAWEPHVTAALESLLEPGATAIDVGANFGYHTLRMSELVGDTGKVFAIEPERVLYQQLLRNVEVNECRNVIALSIAIGARAEICRMTPAQWWLDDQNLGDCFMATSGRSTVSLRLDDVAFARLDLIKLDVQGYEVECLAGMRRTLERHRPYLIVEIEEYCLNRFGASSKQLITALRDLGYVVLLLESEYPAEHICIPNGKHDEFVNHFGARIAAHVDHNAINNNLACGVNRKISLLAT